MNAIKYFQIKTFIKELNCGSHYYNKRATIKWTAHRYMDNVRDQSDLKASALKEMICRDYNVEISLLSCHRTKKMALDILLGKQGEQYKHIREFAGVLIEWNPSTSAYIARDGMFFQRMYVSLAACKRGFLDGCRPLICVDACFLKSRYGGQLHAFIVRDTNDDIYPIAFAVCECEDRHTWAWFLKLLLDDIGYPREHMWSFMFDRQKVQISGNYICQWCNKVVEFYYYNYDEF